MIHRIKRYGWLPDPYDFRDWTGSDAGVKRAQDRSAKAATLRAERWRGQSGESPSPRARSRRSDRRHILAHPPKSLPSAVDLRDTGDFSAVEDQGDIGSCTANAVVGLLEYLWKQTTGAHIDASRLFIYKATRNLMGWTGDSGGYIRAAIKAARLFGVCPEDYWPYDEARFDDEPTAFCYSFAHNYRPLAYYRLEENIDALKASLAANIPFAFGFTCFESIDDISDGGEDAGFIPFPEKNEAAVGGHAVVAVGYDDDRKCIIIRNSWGRSWGEKGYGYLPYRYFSTRRDEKLACDCWCILKSSYEEIPANLDTDQD